MKYVILGGLLLAAVFLVSALTEPGAGDSSVVIGTVIGVQKGKSISVSNEQIGPSGVEIALRDDTVYEGDVDRLAPGSHVTITFRGSGERYVSASTVRIMSAP